MLIKKGNLFTMFARHIKHYRALVDGLPFGEFVMLLISLCRIKDEGMKDLTRLGAW